jgi:PAS domain S-box-containing protein
MFHARMKSVAILASVMNKVEGEFDEVVDSQSQTILIIDDEPANLAVVADYLAQSGFQIKVTQTGEAGLELARRTPPALILLDVQLPGVDGFEVCRRLKADERTRQIPAIFMTVLTAVEDKVKGFEAGGVDYITKPFQPEEVLARVTMHLALRAAQKQLAAQNARLQQEITERKQAEEALAQEQYLMQALMDNVPDYIYFKDRESRFTRTSKSHAQAFGLSDPAQAVGKTDFDFFTEEHARPAYEDEQQIIHTGQPIIKEERETWADRPNTWVLTTKLPLRDEANNIVGTFGISKDITERKRAEAALRESETRYHHLFEQTQATLAETQALYRVSRSVIALESLAEMLQTAVDAVADALPANQVTLITFDLEAQQVTHFVRGGLGADHVMRVPFDELWNGLVGWVLRESKPALSSKSSPDPRESLEAQRRRAETNCGDIIVAPLRYQDKTLGTLTAINLPDEREFTEHDVELMMAMTSQAAMAIENARLYEELQLAHAELERRVEERTAELVQANARLTEEIAERERAEAALRASEERYRRITETITDYVFQVKVQDGRPGDTTHGPGCVEVTGYTPEEFARDPGLWLAMVVPDARPAVLEQARALLAGQHFTPIEHCIVRKDGAVRWVRNTPVPQFGPDGSLVAYDGLIQDITERRALQEQLLQAQKMESVGRLAGGVAHDFNNLLTAILGNVEMAGEDLPVELSADHPVRADLEEVAKAGERAASLTRQLLSFASKQQIVPVRLDLSAVVADSLKMLRRLLGEDVEIVTQLEPKLGAVEADPGQIEQLLVNLAVNSRDAMPNGGRLVIETANEIVDEAYAAIHPELSPWRYARLSVTDTGVGMNEEVRAHLFEPFFTTKERGKGTGLGLATVHGIVRQIGGEIQVYSEPGQGTTFRILLPQVEGVAAEMRAGVAATPTPTGTETVLVVEDEPAVRRLAVLGLRAQGYTVIEAADGAEALEIVARFGAHVDALVSDVIMPGMSGPELAGRLRGISPKTKLLLMSGHAEAAILPHNLGASGIPFLPKPFTPERLARKVREVLDAPREPSSTTQSSPVGVK